MLASLVTMTDFKRYRPEDAGGMDKNAKIYITKHEGMIGSAVMRHLRQSGHTRLLVRADDELDLTDQGAVFRFLAEEKPDYIFLTSAKVGGILANDRYPAEFIYQNIQSQSNVIHAAWQAGVKKMLFFGSSCIYPKECPQPMKEDYLLTGKLEFTSEPYAIAKIAGLKMCQAYNRQYGTNFITAIAADVYGPDDDFDPETGHFLPALMRRIHEAKTGNQDKVIVWGSGAPRRECLHSDDLADAAIFLMNEYKGSEVINIGSGNDFSIRELAYILAEAIGYKGKIVFDKSKPDGAPRKLLDNSKLKELGWSPRIHLEAGIKRTYQWYKKHFLSPEMQGVISR